MWLLYKSVTVAKNKNNNKKEWNCRMVKRQVGILAYLPLGVVVLEMITTGVVLHFGPDPQEGAFPEARTGHFLEIGEEERSLSRERDHKPSHSFSRSRSRSRSNERK